MKISFSVEGKGHEWEWSTKPKSCQKCQSQNDTGCGTEVCIASNKDSIARTYPNLCEFYTDFHDAKEVITIHIGLGSCQKLFSQGGKYHKSAIYDYHYLRI